MILESTTLKSIVEDGLEWGDFGGEESGKAELRKLLDKVDSDEHVEKAIYLDDQEAGNVIAVEGLYKPEFYSFELTSFARLRLAGGSVDGGAIGAVDYDRSYDNIRLLVEVMFGICAVYIKDYSFGYIKPFGDCIYDFNEGNGLMKIDPEVFLEEMIIPKLELDILEGRVDLAKELYDYYHRIPGGNNPFTKQLVNRDDFMSVQEAAKALGISEGRTKRLVEEHTLDGYKIGEERALWLSRDQVQRRIDYIAEHGKPTRGKSKK